MPDPTDPYQVLASVNLEHDFGVRVGAVLHVPFAAPSQRQAVLDNAPDLEPKDPMPVGTALGREVWHAFAANLGVLPVTVVTAWLLVAVSVGTIMAANALAIAPALAACRSRPATMLQAE